jgi:hypothetical protein
MSIMRRDATRRESVRHFFSRQSAKWASSTGSSRTAVPLFLLANGKLFRHPLQVAAGNSVEDVTRDAFAGYSRSGIAGNLKRSGNGFLDLSPHPEPPCPTGPTQQYRGWPKAYVLNEPNL